MGLARSPTPDRITVKQRVYRVQIQKEVIFDLKRDGFVKRGMGVCTI
jgi:hypothetical protein